MPAPIDNFYVQSFATNVALLLQQKDCRFARAVTTGAYSGEAASPVEQVGAVAAQRNGARGQPVRPIEAPTDRPWVYPEDYNLPQLVYSIDKLRVLIDPTSAFNQNAMAAMNRAKDDEVVAAFFADRKTGKAGGTVTQFLAANQVSVDVGGTASGLNVAKLRKAKKLLLSADIDEDEELYGKSGTDEIDVMERWPGYNRFTSNAGLHHVLSDFGARLRTDKILSAGLNLVDEFHRHAVEWREDFITWYIDDNEVFQSVNPCNRPLFALMDITMPQGAPDWANHGDPRACELAIRSFRAWT